jgi:hypothetical protein
MSDLHQTTPDPLSPTTYDSADPDHNGSDYTEFGMQPPDPGPAQTFDYPTPAPGGGDPGLTSTMTGSALPGGATGVTMASTTAGGTTAIGTLVSTFLATAALAGAFALAVYNKNSESEAADSWPVTTTTTRPTATTPTTRRPTTTRPEITKARPTGVAGTWRTGQEYFTISKSGPGAYYYTTECKHRVELTGSDMQVSGRFPVLERGVGEPCSQPILTYVTETITVNSDHNTAQRTLVQSPDEASWWACSFCGRFTMTRFE